MTTPAANRPTPPSPKPPSILLHILVGTKTGLTRHIPYKQWFGDGDSFPVYHDEVLRNLKTTTRMFYRQGRMGKDDLDMLEAFIDNEGFQLDYINEDTTFNADSLDDNSVAFIHNQILDGTNPSTIHHFVVWFPTYLSDLQYPMGLASIPAFIMRSHQVFQTPTTPLTPSSTTMPTPPPTHSSPMVTPASAATQQSWSSPMVGRSRRDDTAGGKFFQGSCPVDLSSVSNPLKRHSDVVNDSIQKISTSPPPPNPWT